ncbi:hypothetical protein LOTGIDRAFT_238770 [Lottia gigantea]|uniref:UBX domain-containing protein n=1 Tax=Lottia gigantea TaxID=225164 RepID=V4AX21_LOTGI|nr:hypothetical protein LOTGIDRAFT_238770 [Lottia gigantea]ESO99605.1 hypothetical protein LOTGIDRAFT_238770 [Lottia gigantea]
METIDIFRMLGQSVLLLAFVSFLIQWFVPQFRKCWCKYITSSQTTLENDNIESINQNKLESANIRTKQQDVHREKAASYSERILKPREEEKIKQQEKQLNRFSGPAWKGEGQILGGNDEGLNVLERDDVSPSEQAARRRHLPEQKVKSNSNCQPQKSAEPKQKKIIILPPEPDTDDKNTVLVKLRTPIRSICQRNFLISNNIQELLDYMTTVGYSQTFYTLSTTYPRTVLTDRVNTTLEDLQFIKQVTLNIEERD